MSESNLKPDRSSRLKALLVIVLTLVIGAIIVIAITWWVIGSAPRSQAVPLAESITVREFALLPADDAYPAALAISADGTVYTGSYQTGALWSISPEGDVREISGARDRIGSVTGLDVAPDGALYILDRIAALEAKGAVLWRYAAGELESLFQIPHFEYRGFLPDDIAVDKAGNIFISDRLGHVLRYNADGAPLGREGQPAWWVMPCRAGCEATGLAYDAAKDALLITDAAAEAIFRIDLAQDPPDNIQRVYDGRGQEHGYGFDGIDIAPDGAVYVALLSANRVAQLQDGALVMLAKDFRGASDLVYDAPRHRLIVTNWNQFSLGFGTRPQLPFALDVIELGAAP